MLYYEPPPSKHRHYLELFLLVLHGIVNGKKKIFFKDHFNQIVREAKIVCQNPMNAGGFESEPYYLAGCMLDYEDLKQEIMQINTMLTRRYPIGFYFDWSPHMHALKRLSKFLIG